ncbi:MAG: hypothetical protein KGL11_11710 [Alphaproteobacteria bacterium]|nr:hypothetical protein [Alphaproteobacteria bacterium]
MWHWILDHRSTFDAIGLAWAIPVVVVLVATKLFPPAYRRGETASELITVRTDKGAETKSPRSAA